MRQGLCSKGILHLEPGVNVHTRVCMGAHMHACTRVHTCVCMCMHVHVCAGMCVCWGWDREQSIRVPGRAAPCPALDRLTQEVGWGLGAAAFPRGPSHHSHDTAPAPGRERPTPRNPS